MNLLEFVLSWNGNAVILAQDGKCLGLISADVSNPDSFISSYGEYGGKYGSLSIHNKFGTYGSAMSLYSPYSEMSFQPPLIICQKQAVALLTCNTSLTRINQWNLLALHPDALVWVYRLLAQQPQAI